MLIAQMAQPPSAAAITRLDRQPCRWLRLSLDRFEDSALVMTREPIASMLGLCGEGQT